MRFKTESQNVTSGKQTSGRTDERKARAIRADKQPLLYTLQLLWAYTDTVSRRDVRMS